MNVTIPIEVSGDIWYNEQSIRQQLEHLSSDTEITLDLRSEGPSLHRLGITAVIDTWLAQHNLQPNTITITRWSNSGEPIHYKKFRCSVPSHFWYYAQEYQLPPEHTFSGAKSYLFGLFLGRATVHRNVILYEVQQQWANRFLISRLTALTPHGTPVPEPWNMQNYLGWRLPETLAEWVPGNEQQVIDWFATQRFTSLDSRTVRDQYGDPDNHLVHNRSMLAHYDKFNIELVCESYTLGQTFFPTEKTARPIAGTRSWLIYAAPGYIQHLKRMGFRSFDSLWDESYDQLEGPARWSAMKQVIQTLIDLDASQLNDILTQAHEIALHNRLHLETVQP
jgi:hypothetical protein